MGVSMADDCGVPGAQASPGPRALHTISLAHLAHGVCQWLISAGAQALRWAAQALRTSLFSASKQECVASIIRFQIAQLEDPPVAALDQVKAFALFIIAVRMLVEQLGQVLLERALFRKLTHCPAIKLVGQTG